MNWPPVEPQSGPENLTYDVFVNDSPPQDNGLLPNGEPKLFSPLASTLIYGSEDAVLTDPGMTADQARALGDWVAGTGRNLTDIFLTQGIPPSPVIAVTVPGNRFTVEGHDLVIVEVGHTDREHRRRLLQRENRAVSKPPGPDGALGRCQRALRRARTPWGGRRPDPRCRLALSRQRYHQDQGIQSVR
jgi:hypothetical protein